MMFFWSAAAAPALRAAIAVAEINPKLSVAVVSKVYPMRSHTVSAEGGAAGVIAEDDSLDEHAYDTISGGDWLSDQDASRSSSTKLPRSCCSWSIGDVRGAGATTARSRCARSAG